LRTLFFCNLPLNPQAWSILRGEDKGDSKVPENRRDLTISPSNLGAILLLGYNRLDSLLSRLEEINRFNSKQLELYVSIDGGGLTKGEFLNGAELRGIKVNTKKVSIGRKNLGVDRHYFNAASRLFKTYEYLIVIEDDIKIFRETLKVICEKIDDIKLNKNDFCINSMGPLRGFSGFQRLGLKLNTWYVSPFFNCWGHAISKNYFFQAQSLFANGIQKGLFMEHKLNHRLSLRQRRLWMQRFERRNYDYVLQITAFIHEWTIQRPLFRIIDNLGFDDIRSTHTKGKRPYFMGKEISAPILFKEVGDLKSSAISKVFVFLERLTFAGDSLFSARGRNLGVRSLLKRLIKK
jgi:hypothetical protein